MEKTDVLCDDLRNVVETVVGGSVVHRLAIESAPRGSMINSLRTFNTHVHIITDIV